MNRHTHTPYFLSKAFSDRYLSLDAVYILPDCELYIQCRCLLPGVALKIVDGLNDGCSLTDLSLSTKRYLLNRNDKIEKGYWDLFTRHCVRFGINYVLAIYFDLIID